MHILRLFNARLILVLSLAAAAVPVTAQQSLPAGLAPCDSVETRGKPGSSCIDWTIKNRNPQQVEIRRIRLEIQTAGYEWLGTADAGAWNVVRLAPNILEFDGGARGIRPGVDFTIRNVCLDRICQTTADYAVIWKTFDAGGQICSGTVVLSCLRLASYDTLVAHPTPGNTNCYELGLLNTNAAVSALDEFRLAVLTPDVRINASTTNGWSVRRNDGRAVEFAGGKNVVAPGTEQRGFNVCFSQVPQDLDTVALHWESRFQGLIITVDTFYLPLVKEERCDSLALWASASPGVQRCWSATLFNLHEPSGPVDAMTLEILSPDAVFLSGTSGPWPVTQSTPIFTRWSSGGSGLAPQDSLTGFRFCVLNSGTSDTVRLRLTSREGGADLCSTDFDIFATATQERICDRITSRRVSGDSYSFGFVNLRQPQTPVNGLSLKIVGGGAVIDTVVTPINWTVDFADDTLVQTGTSIGVVPNAQLSGIQARFAFAGDADTALVALCTTLDGRNPCCDTLRLALAAEETRCDSLILHKAPGEDECLWRAGFVNTHLPASQTTHFRMTMLSVDASFSLGAVPAGWRVVSDGSGGQLVLERGTATEDSLLFDLQFASSTGDSVYIFEWCTEDANGVICCGTESMICRTAPRCDRFEVRASTESMAQEVRIRNEHTPASEIGAIRLAILTPGATISASGYPPSWSYVTNQPGDTIHLVMPSPIPPDSATGWFTVHVTPVPGCDSVRYSWTTLEGIPGSGICSGDAPPVPCAAAACDTLTVTAMPFRPCCFDITVKNALTSAIDRLVLRVITPGAIVYPSLVQGPDGWDVAADTLGITWTTSSAQIPPGSDLRGFAVCYDNDVTGNADFRVLWETYVGRTLRCSDTLTIACDRTLDIRRLEAPMPARMQLHQNYPNPFRGRTQLTFALPEPTNLALQVFDTHGRLVAAVCEGSYDAGSYRVTFDATGLPAGAYLLRLSADGRVLTRLMSLVR